MESHKESKTQPCHLVWLPTTLYALCFSVIEFSSGSKQPYFENPIDYIWRIPIGMTTLAILPFLVSYYVSWLSRKIPQSTAYYHSLRSRWIVDSVPYILAFMLCLADHPRAAYTITATLIWAIIRSIFAVASSTQSSQRKLTESPEYIAILFFFSGFSALVYQIVWQRILFTAYGVDSESITIIVSVFMLGLGIGALAGSWMVRYRSMLLRIFLVIEVSIGLFGVISIPLADILLNAITIESKLGLTFVSYLLFALPTLLMGATLPLLIGFINLKYQNIGRSTSLLYAANTLGSAIAALMTVSVIFVLTGLRSATVIAASLNIFTAVLLYFSLKGLETKHVEADVPPSRNLFKMAFWQMSTISFLIGFIALSGELLYFRLLSFTSSGLPQVFGWLLAAYLFGIALGSFRIKNLCEKSTEKIRISGFLFLAGIVLLYSPLLLSLASAASSRTFSLMVGFVACGSFGYWTGGVFPYLGFVTANSEVKDRERRISLVYLFNILGAALGPVLTGYLLLDILSIMQLTIVLAILLFLVAVFLLEEARQQTRTIVLVTVLLVLCPLVSQRYLGRLQSEHYSPPPLKHVVENRVSIITVKQSEAGDVIYGGGIYDGRFNIDPLNNSNGILRAYYAACLHPKPRRVLEIGLSSGSWAKVLASHKGVKELITVEINPGYLEVISKHPIVSDLLDNPKVKIINDDGRKWLRQNPNEKFDIIVMNTTFHWRANATNLLSQEFLRLAKSHLTEGGVIYYNSTGSQDVPFTTASVFKHVVQFANFYAGSDWPFNLNELQRRSALLNFIDNQGSPILAGSQQHHKVLDHLAKKELTDIGPKLRQSVYLRTITDDNMLTEYKTNY